MGKDKILYKEVEKRLYSYKISKARIESYKLKIQKERLTGEGAIDYTKPNTSETNKINSITEIAAVNNIENEEKLLKKIKEDEIEVQMLEIAFEALTKEEFNVVKAYYIENYRWLEIEGKVGLNEKTCRRLRDKALHKMIYVIYGYKTSDFENVLKMSEECP